MKNEEIEGLLTLAGTRGFTMKDFAALAIAAADQAGLSIKDQLELDKKLRLVTEAE